MTTPSRRPLQGFGQQLGRLQRLAQPYFLPVEESRSWQFLLLVVALLVVVVGVTLLLLTAAVQISGALIPNLQERFLRGSLSGSMRSGRVGLSIGEWVHPGGWRLFCGLSQQASSGALVALVAPGCDCSVDPGD